MDSDRCSCLFLADLSDGIPVSHKTVDRPFPRFPDILRSVRAGPVHLITVALVNDSLAFTSDVSFDGNLFPSEGNNHFLDDSYTRVTSVWTKSASNFRALIEAIWFLPGGSSALGSWQLGSDQLISKIPGSAAVATGG